MRRILATVVLMLLVAAPASLAAPPAHHALPADCVFVGNTRAGNELYECVPDATATPEPTGTSAPTETPGPTETPAPTSTVGSSPTLPVPPTATSVAGIAPYPSAPLCAGHDARAYHSLWSTFDGCHFDHHHGDNPHDADDALRTDLYDVMGGEISYPWQTFSAAGIENDLKHAGYYWHVRTDIPCTTNPGNTPPPCISAFRALVHQHASGRDATVRYHSYVLEAATSDGGYFRFGGWADFGDLHSPEGTIVVNEPDNHDSRACTGAGRHKQHGPNSSSAPQIIWYGASQQTHDACGPRGYVTLSVSVHDVWDYTDPANPAAFTDYHCYPAPNCTANATTLRPHLISINMSVSRWNSLIDPDGNGRADWEGYANRYGELLPNGTCVEVSVDCVPVVFRNLRVGHTYGAASSHTSNSYRDYDIYFDGRTSGWSQPVP